MLADVPIVFRSNESSVFDALDDGTPDDGLGEGETLAIWLDILQTSPGAEPVHIERALMDRIGAERRLQPLDFTDAATRSAIEPVTLVDFYDGTQTIDQLAAVHLLHTDLARLDLTHALSDAKSGEVYGAAGFNVPAMTTRRDTLRLTDEVPLGFQSVIGRPQFTLTSLSLVDAGGGSAIQDVELGIDILHHHPQIVPVSGTTMVGT